MSEKRKEAAAVQPAEAAQSKSKRAPTPKSFQAKAKAHALEALETLASLAKGAASESVRVSAANAVLDRAYGKPASGARAAGTRTDEEEVFSGPLEVQWLDPEKS